MNQITLKLTEGQLRTIKLCLELSKDNFSSQEMKDAVSEIIAAFNAQSTGGK
jgi:hypothetical protein